MRRFLAPLAASCLLTCCATAVQDLKIACGYDEAGQPIVATLAASLVPSAASAVATDQTLVHPAVIAACAAIGGVPAAVVD